RRIAPGHRAARAAGNRRRDARAGARFVARHREAGAAVTYVRDVGALARKDLLLELRARETVPAMVLFVLATFVVFHFALPSGATDDVARGLLWAALLFTSLLGLTRAFVPEREQSMLDALVLSPVDRSAIWLAKSLSVVAFLALAELVALPAFGAFFS